MEGCMHWEATYETDGEVVRRTCPECGASGTQPRCAGIVTGKSPRNGERCRRRADADGQRCIYHVDSLQTVA